MSDLLFQNSTPLQRRNNLQFIELMKSASDVNANEGSISGASVQDNYATFDNDNKEYKHGNHTMNVIINPVLTYVVYALDTSSAQHVSNCCSQFYTAEELNNAKDILWQVADPDIIGPYKRRNDGSTRSREEALAVDVTEAMKKLDAAGFTPQLAVDPIGLHRIPKVTPAETEPIAMCERLVAMESRVKSLETSLSANVARTLSVEEKVEGMCGYANAARPTPPTVMPPPRTMKKAAPVNVTADVHATLVSNVPLDQTKIKPCATVQRPQNISRDARYQIAGGRKLEDRKSVV